MWTLKMDWKLQFQLSSAHVQEAKEIFFQQVKNKFIQNDSPEISRSRFNEWALSIIMTIAGYQSKLMEIYNAGNLALHIYLPLSDFISQFHVNDPSWWFCMSSLTIHWDETVSHVSSISGSTFISQSHHRSVCVSGQWHK